MTRIFCCPVCSNALIKEQNDLRCIMGHSFNIAKEGYTNLALSNRSHTKVSGDDRDMVRSRTLFLEGGYYEPLRDTMCTLIEKTKMSSPVLVDSGCGEGYYTYAYCRTVSKMGGRTAGIDLSKAAIKHAAKTCPDGEFAVASVYHIPIADSTVDIVVNCFSPLAPAEFCRILKKGGYFFYVVPDAEHLWQLKEVLYDVPYKNEVKLEEYDGFEYVDTVQVKNKFTLDGGEKILALLNMTPYGHRTARDSIERLKKLSSLEVTAQFRIIVYRKADI